jgi:anti-sigma factor RsiW
MTHLSDEFLLAYVDGQLEKAQTEEVSKIAGSNAELSRRVERLRRTQAQLIETLSGFAQEEIAVPANFLQLESSETKPKAQAQALPKAAPKGRARKAGRALKKGLFISAVFAGGLLGGYGATLVTAQRAAPLTPKITDRPPAAVLSAASWASDIAQFHSFFPREMLTPHPDAIANPEFIRFQLARITAKALTPPDFTHYGFSLYRGQTLKYRQDNMMQLTYSSKTEPPLTLYVLPADGYGDSGVMSQIFGSYKAVSWVSDRVRLLLTAEKSEEDLKVLAALAQSQMPKRP